MRSGAGMQEAEELADLALHRRGEAAHGTVECRDDLGMAACRAASSAGNAPASTTGTSAPTGAPGARVEEFRRSRGQHGAVDPARQREHRRAGEAHLEERAARRPRHRSSIRMSRSKRAPYGGRNQPRRFRRGW
jgi:hypothetical protein